MLSYIRCGYKTTADSLYIFKYILIYNPIHIAVNENLLLQETVLKVSFNDLLSAKQRNRYYTKKSLHQTVVTYTTSTN